MSGDIFSTIPPTVLIEVMTRKESEKSFTRLFTQEEMEWMRKQHLAEQDRESYRWWEPNPESK